MRQRGSTQAGGGHDEPTDKTLINLQVYGVLADFLDCHLWRFCPLSRGPLNRWAKASGTPNNLHRACAHRMAVGQGDLPGIIQSARSVPLKLRACSQRHETDCIQNTAMWCSPSSGSLMLVTVPVIACICWHALERGAGTAFALLLPYLLFSILPLQRHVVEPPFPVSMACRIYRPAQRSAALPADGQPVLTCVSR